MNNIYQIPKCSPHGINLEWLASGARKKSEKTMYPCTQYIRAEKNYLVATNGKVLFKLNVDPTIYNLEVGASYEILKNNKKFIELKKVTRFHNFPSINLCFPKKEECKKIELGKISQNTAAKIILETQMIFDLDNLKNAFSFLKDRKENLTAFIPITGETSAAVNWKVLLIEDIESLHQIVMMPTLETEY